MRLCHRVSGFLVTLLLLVQVAMHADGETMNNMIDVTAHGAIPSDGNDDTTAVLRAIDAARRTPRPTLLFPPGRYDFFAGANPAAPHAIAVVHEIHNLTLEAQGAELVYHGVTMPFSFHHCNDLVVRGLVIDWARPPFSQGVVLDCTDTHFDVDVFPEYPVQGGEPVGAFMDYDPANGLIRANAVDAYWAVTRTELIRPQVLRVFTKYPVRMPSGVWVVLRHHVYDRCAILFAECNNVLVQDTTVYTAPGMGLVGENCHGVTLERFSVRIRPGTGRLMSTAADATHFSRCHGTVTMRDCFFEGMGDDAGNFKGLYLTVLNIRDAHTVWGQHNLKIPHLPFVGDSMNFVRRESLLPFATGTVRAATLDVGDGVHAVEFVDPVPADLKVGDLLANTTRIPRVRVSGCTVRNNRARGFLVQTHDAIIEDSTFENCTAGGVFVMTECVYFFESLGTQDVILRNNRFTNCAYAAVAGIESAVTIFAYLDEFRLPTWPGIHKNITVESNTIRGSRNCGIFAASVDGLVIRNNLIEGVCEAPTRDQGRAAIYLMGCANVTVAGNRIDPAAQGSAFEIAVLAGPGCATDTVSLD